MVFTTRVKYWFLIGVMLCAFLPSPAGATDGADLDDDTTTQSEMPTLTTEPEQTAGVIDEAASAATPGDAPGRQLPALTHKPAKDATPTADKSSYRFRLDTAEEIRLKPLVVPANANVVVSGLQIDEVERLVALELYNTTTGFVDLSQWTINVVYLDNETEKPCTVYPSDYLGAKQYVTITDGDASIDVSWPKNAVADGGELSCAGAKGKLAAIEVVATNSDHADIVERVDVEAIDRMNEAKAPGDPDVTTMGVWTRKSFSSTGRTGDFLIDFPVKLHNHRLLSYGQLHKVPASAPLQITEVYVTPPQCAPNDTTPLCHRYFKVRNVSQDEIDLSRFRLRAGSPTSRSTTRNTTTLSGKIVSGETVIISQSASGDDIYLGSSDGTVWFEDSYGLRDYKSESSVVPYASASTVKNTGLSWALDVSDDTWKWSLPSPDSANNIIELPQTTTSVAKTGGLVPCRSDQYRNVDTNRCRLIASAINSLTPCKTGQYRSPTTNRCRSSTLAGSTLKPCHDDQYRSEATNRCRSVLGASTSRKPCTDKQYRSEETNRCRNKIASAVPQAAFAVEPIADSSTAFMGWWLLGGASAVALGYGAWEWRREMLTGIRKLGSIITRQR